MNSVTIILEALRIWIGILLILSLIIKGKDRIHIFDPQFLIVF